MDKMQIKQKAFGIEFKFLDTPEDWTEDEAEVWFSAWHPGDPTSIILQKQCELRAANYWLVVEAGDFDDTPPGIYYYELARYEEEVKLDPTFTGELEILESAGVPGGEE